jgi:hypothetical protein
VRHLEMVDLEIVPGGGGLVCGRRVRRRVGRVAAGVFRVCVSLLLGLGLTRTVIHSTRFVTIYCV